MIYSRDPKKLNKEGPIRDDVSFTFRRGNKIFIGGKKGGKELGQEQAEREWGGKWGSRSRCMERQESRCLGKWEGRISRKLQRPGLDVPRNQFG